MSNREGVWAAIVIFVALVAAMSANLAYPSDPTARAVSVLHVLALFYPAALAVQPHWLGRPRRVRPRSPSWRVQLGITCLILAALVPFVILAALTDGGTLRSR